MSETPRERDVWVVTESVPHEGDMLLGVYASDDAAKQAYPERPWEPIGPSDSTCWRSRGPGVTLFIGRYEVQS